MRDLPRLRNAAIACIAVRTSLAGVSGRAGGGDDASAWTVAASFARCTGLVASRKGSGFARAV